MRRWLKIAVPMGIAAVAVTVLAIGFGSPRSDAAQCMGDAPEATAVHGRAGSETYGFAFCSDPTLMLVVSVQWDSVRKDLGLRVTEPDGTVHLVDHTQGRSETFRHEAPLPEGDWTVEVFNNGNGSVQYGLGIVFETDPNAGP
jgi:hypothetical protein